MQYLLTTLITLASLGFIVSHINHPVYVLAVPALLMFFSKNIAELLVNFINTPIDEVITKKAKKTHIAENKIQISEQFIKTTFQISGHIANADGTICDNEKDYIDKIIIKFNLKDEQINLAKYYFIEGTSNQFKFERSMSEFINVCGEVPALLEAFLETQLYITKVSKTITIREFNIIEKIQHYLRLDERYALIIEEYKQQSIEHTENLAQQKVNEKIRERNEKRKNAEQEKLDKKQNTQSRKILIALLTLGLKNQSSAREIKQAYRKQIKLNHPDNLIANGYPIEMLRQATEKSADINAAYSLLKSHYKFK